MKPGSKTKRSVFYYRKKIKPGSNQLLITKYRFVLKGLLFFFCVCTRCCLLRVCLPHQHGSSPNAAGFASVYHHNTKLDMVCNLWSEWYTTTDKLFGPVIGVQV